MADRTRDLLWSDVDTLYGAILAHPFVTGLTDGSLPHETFRHYIVQDAHYLRGYATALAVCAAKAPTDDDTLMFAEHAAGAIAAERELHADLLGALGLTSEQARELPVAPAPRGLGRAAPGRSARTGERARHAVAWRARRGDGRAALDLGMERRGPVRTRPRPVRRLPAAVE